MTNDEIRMTNEGQISSLVIPVSSFREAVYADFAIASLAISKQAFISSIGFIGLASYSSERALSEENLIWRRALNKPTTSRWPLPRTTLGDFLPLSAWSFM